MVDVDCTYYYEDDDSDRCLLYNKDIHVLPCECWHCTGFKSHRDAKEEESCQD